jgi:GDP-L-fucose synthase
METYSDNDILNIGTGRDYTIVELIEIVKEVVNYEGEVIYDVSKPDGVLVKLQDITKMSKLGWRHEVGLKEGIRRVYDEFKTMS